ncbi:MAG: putative glycoside hydrolase family 15 protein [Armatimonadota bacterium]|nr:putative glycoside hydrolase family 15 protein [Armatimonadota bacterium]
MSLALFSPIAFGPGAAETSVPQTDAGRVHFVKRQGPDFDKYTKPGETTYHAWIQKHFWRMMEYTPFWDTDTRWYPRALLYKDSYAIYNNADAKPLMKYVLKDAQGKPLFIPWGCSNGTCPQYAADISSLDYRRSWIEEAAKNLHKGYRGLWVDDVNLDMSRVSDGSGKSVTPIDPNTGKPMTEAAWEHYFADFMAEVRRALPQAEILHNTLWFAGKEDARNLNVQKEISSADLINIEGGLTDSGLTGGTGYWSFSQKLAFADRVHALGRNVVIDDFDDTAQGKEYALAGYLLISNGGDGLGGNSKVSPEHWWNGYETNLGAARSVRTRSRNGLFQRDFAHGLVLLNEPGASPAHVLLPGPYRTLSGETVTSVTLGPKEGAVLTRPPHN